MSFENRSILNLYHATVATCKQIAPARVDLQRRSSSYRSVVNMDAFVVAETCPLDNTCRFACRRFCVKLTRSWPAASQLLYRKWCACVLTASKPAFYVTCDLYLTKEESLQCNVFVSFSWLEKAVFYFGTRKYNISSTINFDVASVVIGPNPRSFGLNAFEISPR